MRRAAVIAGAAALMGAGWIASRLVRLDRSGEVDVDRDPSTVSTVLVPSSDAVPSRPSFVVRRSVGSLHARGRSPRGEADALVTPNVPFRSLTAMVVDVPIEGRIVRRFEFLVDAVRDPEIDGHFSDGEPCTLRLVGSPGPVDPMPRRLESSV
jgi:hypothetical protein